MSLQGAHLSVERTIPSTADDEGRCVICFAPVSEMREEQNKTFVIDHRSKQAAHLSCVNGWFHQAPEDSRCLMCQNPMQEKDFEVLDQIPPVQFDGLHEGKTEDLITHLRHELERVNQELQTSSDELRHEKNRFGYGLLWTMPGLEARVKSLAREKKNLLYRIERTQKFQGQTTHAVLNSSWKSIALSIASFITLGTALAVEKAFSTHEAPKDDPVKQAVAFGFLSSGVALGVGIYNAWDAVGEAYSRFSYS